MTRPSIPLSGTVYPHPLANGISKNLITNPSFEVNTDGFVNDIGTVARSTARARHGTASAMVTRTASGVGASDVYWNSPGVGYPCEAEVVYTFTCWVYPTVTRDFLVQIYQRDYDTETEVGSRLQNTAVSCPAGQWTKLSFTFTTYATVDALLPLIYALNVAQNEVFYTDAWCVTPGAADIGYFDGGEAGAEWAGTANLAVSYGTRVRENLMRNPSVKTDLTGHTANGAATVTRDNAVWPDSGYSIKVVGPGTNAWDGAILGYFGGMGARAAQGETFSCSALVHFPSPPDGARLSFGLILWDAGGAFVGAPTLYFDDWEDGETRLVKAEGIAATGTLGDTTYVSLVVYVNDGVNALAATYYVDELLLERGSTVGAYFDGDDPQAAWEGTANDSFSYEPTSFVVRGNDIVLPPVLPAGETRDGDAIAHLLEAKAAVLDQPLRDNFDRANEAIEASANWTAYYQTGSGMAISNRRMVATGANYGVCGWEGAYKAPPAVTGVTLASVSERYDHYIGFVDPPDYDDADDPVAAEVMFAKRPSWYEGDTTWVGMYLICRIGGANGPTLYREYHETPLSFSLVAGDKIAASWDGATCIAWVCHDGRWQHATAMTANGATQALHATRQTRPEVWLSNHDPGTGSNSADDFFYSVY